MLTVNEIQTNRDSTRITTPKINEMDSDIGAKADSSHYEPIERGGLVSCRWTRENLEPLNYYVAGDSEKEIPMS